MSISIPANTQLQKVGTVQLGALPYDAYIAMPEGVSFDPMSKTAQKVQTRLHRYLLAQAKREDFISTKPGRHAEFASQDSRIAMKIEDEGMKDGQGKVIRGNNATINLAQGTNASGMGTNLLAGEKEHSWSGVLGDLRKRLTTDKGCPTTVAVSVLWEDLKVLANFVLNAM
jgi:heat shock protein HslJ